MLVKILERPTRDEEQAALADVAKALGLPYVAGDRVLYGSGLRSQVTALGFVESSPSTFIRGDLGLQVGASTLNVLWVRTSEIDSVELLGVELLHEKAGYYTRSDLLTVWRHFRTMGIFDIPPVGRFGTKGTILIPYRGKQLAVEIQSLPSVNKTRFTFHPI